jgi:hypothetical protein
MEEVVAPLLHNNDPEKSEAVNTELPQLLTTVTVGVATTELIGEAMALAAALVHPFTVCVTVYVPPTVTVIEDAVAPLLHNNDPEKSEPVNTELPQLLATVIVGGAGVVFGAAVPLPAVLVHPLTVCATV